MRATFFSLVLLVMISGARPVAAQAAPIGGDSYQLAPYVQQAPAWSAADEAWYQRNRRFRIAGKVLTVVGLAALMSGAFARDDATFISGGSVQYVGQIIWGASELRGANEMRRRGVYVTKVPGILAVCGAFLFSPLTWIAGPIQSARLREAHDRLGFAQAPTPPRARTLGVGLTTAF